VVSPSLPRVALCSSLLAASAGCSFSDDDTGELAQRLEAVESFKACEGEPVTYVDALARLNVAGLRSKSARVGRFAIGFKELQDSGVALGRWTVAADEAFVAWTDAGGTARDLAELPRTGHVELVNTSADENSLHRDGAFLWFIGDPVTVEGRTFQLRGFLMAWSSAEERASPDLWAEEKSGAVHPIRFKGRLADGRRRTSSTRGMTTITRGCSRFVSLQDPDAGSVAFAIDMSLRFDR
jgi:hypothetical protein